jgi:hypothetical protein
MISSAFGPRNVCLHLGGFGSHIFVFRGEQRQDFVPATSMRICRRRPGQNVQLPVKPSAQACMSGLTLKSVTTNWAKYLTPICGFSFRVVASYG